MVASVDGAEQLPKADLLLCATSTTERIVRDEHLRSAAVVCDVSRPSNVCTEVCHRRPDVLVIDGGIIRMPSGATLSFKTSSLDRGQAYACMAETMMLAITQRYADTSLGFDLPLEQVFAMDRLARELGFQVVLDRRTG